MATYPLTLSGNTTVTAVYNDANKAQLAITAARYNNSTNKVELDWSITLLNPTGHNRYTISAYAGYINGTEVNFTHANDGSYLYTYETWQDGKVVATGTAYIDAAKGTNQNITLAVKILFNYGYSASRWADSSKYSYGSGTAVSPTPGDPTISASISSSTAASRGGANGKATVTATGISAGTNGGTASYTVTINGSSASANVASKEATGLKNNTSYAYSAVITNSFGLSKTVSGTFYLTPLVPALAVSASPSRTTATLTLTPTYDTLRKFGSYSIKYGKTTNYGLTATSGSLTGLEPNTKYYYSATVTDANNGGAYASALTSSAVTGSFTTTGNAPTISSVTPTPTRTGCSLSVSASFDTNASASSYAVQYGTTNSYGSSSTSTSLSGLTPNTTYYYSITVTDNFGRTSTAYTGTFKTTGNAPSISSVSASATRTGCTLTPTVTYDTNASLASYSIRYGTTTSYGSTSTSTSLTSLTPNTKYYYSITATDNQGRTSAAYTGDFTTSGNAPVVGGVSVRAGVSTANFSYAVIYDTNASFGSLTIQYGTTSSYGSISNSASLTGLLPNTTYYYSLTQTDNKGRTSTAVTGSFTTLADQASMDIKGSSGWVSGKAWLKTASGWVKAKKVYTKTSNGWKEGV